MVSDPVSQAPTISSGSVFDRRATCYDRLSWVGDARFAGAIEALFRPGPLGHALDLACGTGSLTKTLASHAACTAAVDISSRMLRLAIDKAASTRFDRVCWIQADGERLPFQRGMFDLILCRNGLHHFENPNVGLEEIRRILDMDGQFILVEPVAPSAIGKAHWSEAFRLRDKGRHPSFYFTEDELVAYVTSQHFALAQCESLRIEQELGNWLDTGCLSVEEMTTIHQYITKLSDEARSSIGVTFSFRQLVIIHRWALLSLVPMQRSRE